MNGSIAIAFEMQPALSHDTYTRTHARDEALKNCDRAYLFIHRGKSTQHSFITIDLMLHFMEVVFTTRALAAAKL